MTLGDRESCTLDSWHIKDVSAYRRGACRGNVSQGIFLGFQKDKWKGGNKYFESFKIPLTYFYNKKELAFLVVLLY